MWRFTADFIALNQLATIPDMFITVPGSYSSPAPRQVHRIPEGDAPRIVDCITDCIAM